jgi:phosphoglycolate phosphatase-like HAD superfamily hydrolase
MKKKPLVIKNDLIIPCDVDKTLIDYDIKGKDERELVELGLPGCNKIKVFPIHDHIEMLKNMASSNGYIIVWSGSGYSWAKHVLEKLGLLAYVDQIVSKPRWYLDDVSADEWMKRLYIYKKYQ